MGCDDGGEYPKRLAKAHAPLANRKGPAVTRRRQWRLCKSLNTFVRNGNTKGALLRDIAEGALNEPHVQAGRVETAGAGAERRSWIDIRRPASDDTPHTSCNGVPDDRCRKAEKTF